MPILSPGETVKSPSESVTGSTWKPVFRITCWQIALMAAMLIISFTGYQNKIALTDDGPELLLGPGPSPGGIASGGVTLPQTFSTSFGAVLGENNRGLRWIFQI